MEVEVEAPGVVPVLVLVLVGQTVPPALAAEQPSILNKLPDPAS